MGRGETNNEHWPNTALIFWTCRKSSLASCWQDRMFGKTTANPGRSASDSFADGSWRSCLQSVPRSSASSPHERRTHVKKHATKKRLRTNWARIDALKDREIDTSDIPEQGNAFFKRAVLRLPEPKTAVTIRLDRQVLDWFKAKGPGYQTRINALLRAYMEAH